jgi:acetyl-CoA synthetase
MGWIVGPILVYGMPAIGSTIVLVEGAPNFPDADRMWRLVAEQKVTYLGVAPTTIRTFMAQGSEPWKTYDLSRIRILVSSGEAWTADAWKWLFDNIGKRRVPILNFSGGTEMIGIIGCTVLSPLKPNGFNCAMPGVGADIADEQGNSAAADAVGELIMRRPSIGLTRGLWKDRERYLETYWSTWPNVWHHGDFASRDADGQWYIYGRSDDTMKIAGKRTGPAEIESLLLATGKLGEAAAVAVPDPIKGSALVIVCTLRPGVQASAELQRELSQLIAHGLGAPFRPKQVLFVSDLPKTRNMKIMRRVIRAACLGNDAGDLSSLVNPEAVNELRALAAAARH